MRKVQKRAIDAARRSGVSHVFYSSLAFGGDCAPTSVAKVMHAHLDTEEYLASIAAEDPSFTYTAIRVGLYSESFPIYLSFLDTKSPADEIKIPHDGSGPGIAWAKRDELGEATARLLALYSASPEKFPYTNRTILLSGPRVWSLNETVDLLGRFLKKPISLREVSVDEYAAQPEVEKNLTYGDLNTVKFWATSYEAIRLGETAVVSPILAQMLGREPEPFEKTVQDLL
jgi:hypothetical protein